MKILIYLLNRIWKLPYSLENLNSLFKENIQSKLLSNLLTTSNTGIIIIQCPTQHTNRLSFVVFVSF